MKKLFLILLALLSFGGLQAQTFDVQFGDTSLANYSPGQQGLKVLNPMRIIGGASARVLEWRYLTDNIPSSWQVEGVCDNVLCHSLAAIKSGGWNRTDTITPGTPANFYFSLLSVPTNGVGILRVEIRDPQAPSYTRIVTFIANRSPQGISTTVRVDENIKVFPNPARESVNVTFENNDNIKTIGVYNLLGQPISMYHTVGNSANIPLNDAPAGVYFLRMFDGQGKIVATRRFTRQ